MDSWEINYKRISLTLIILISIGFLPAKADNIPVVIENTEDGEKALEKSLDVLKEHLRMRFGLPVEVKVVTGSELDKLLPNSPYKGSIVGVYKFRDGRHMIYMMRGVHRDKFHGTLCHELTHAWQAENCPPQDIYLREGLAVWVQYKSLRWVGAYTMARNLNQYIADPVYGVGYRFVQKLEDKYGESGVLEEIRKYRRIPRNF